MKFHDTTEFLPSSESENNNGLADKAGGGQRSVFLHAACVADIPVQGPEGKRGPRAVSADASLSGGRDAVRSGPPPMQQRPQGRV